MLTSAHSDAELFLFIRSTAFPHGRRQNPMVAHNWFGQESRPFLGFGTHIEIFWRFVNGKYSCSWLCSMHICLVELVCVCIYIYISLYLSAFRFCICMFFHISDTFWLMIYGHICCNIIATYVLYK